MCVWLHESTKRRADQIFVIFVVSSFSEYREAGSIELNLHELFNDKGGGGVTPSHKQTNKTRRYIIIIIIIMMTLFVKGKKKKFVRSEE